MTYIFCNASKKERHTYVQSLRAVSSFSNLFSESDTPYIDYRIVENLFCNCFNAENLSRSCLAIDARCESIGVGIKTFISTPFQKIAEFDKKRSYTDTGNVLEDAYRISELRNERLDFSRNAYSIDEFIYHYIVRGPKSLSIHECAMDYINTDKIKLIRNNEKGFDFTDGNNIYRYIRSKSTILKSFQLNNPLYEFGIDYLINPLNTMISAYEGEIIINSANTKEKPTLVLPLFSKRGSIHVPEKSGLNQWNANGRIRNYDEIYIPFNKEDRILHPDFFPDRDVAFDLELPNGEILSAKVCQEQGKAIMSNPNKDLGRWLLRDVLKLKEGQLVTLDILDDMGVNAILFTKEDKGKYSIDFTFIDYD